MSRPAKNPEFDAYIQKSAPFAQPILKHLRKLFHRACPEIEETIKWGFPHFEYKGIVGSMAAFKQHASWGFWNAKLMQDPHGLLSSIGNTSMGSMKVTSLKDLPADDVVLSYILEAVSLNESGKKAPHPAKKRGPTRELEVPAELQAALKKNKAALAAFNGFSPSHRNEYIEWITEAKQEATRQRRLATTLEWLVEGKSRNWKYQ